MPTSNALPRRTGEPLSCGGRRSAGSRGHAIRLPRRFAVLAFAAAAVGLAGDGALAQSSGQEIPPALQQPLPVQPGQPQPTQQQQPAQQQAPQGQPQPGTNPAAEGQRFGDWIERCTPNPPPGASPPPAGKQNVCFLIQQVSDQNTRRPLLKITVGFFGPERRAGAVVAMPLGVPLARGLQVSVDGKEIDTVPFQICERDGCQAFLPMDDAMVGAFKAGSTAQVKVESGQGQDFALPISLNGFTAGFGSIQ